MDIYKIPFEPFAINRNCTSCGECIKIAPENFFPEQDKIVQPRNEKEGKLCNDAASKCPTGTIVGEAFSQFYIQINECSKYKSFCDGLCTCKLIERGCIIHQPNNLADVNTVKEAIERCPSRAIGFWE